MKNFLESKLGIFLFISASIGVLFLYVVLSSIEPGGQPGAGSGEDQYYLNENYSEGDELVTKVPNLSDMLAGPIISWTDPNLGDKYAKVVIVEYSDYKCDYCRAQELNLKRILEDYRDYVRIIWKDYPEADENSESYQAAMAGRCAHEQGRFWEYHDFLFEYNDDLGRENLERLAGLAGLNLNDFNDCMDNDAKIKEQINDNIKEANALGITGIPFIYVNSQELMGEASYNELKQLVEVELGR